jgi:hypothetical protein
VGRKLTMLATVVVLPGGLLLLIAVALTIVLMRSGRGRRLLLPLKRRVPPRLRASVKRVLAIATGENLFLPAPPRIHSS